MALPPYIRVIALVSALLTSVPTLVLAADCEGDLSATAMTVLGPPQGTLTRIGSPPHRVTQPALIAQDGVGRRWYLKSDIHHAELQTTAEVISAWIYRHFGFPAPETYIVTFEGRRYSASAMMAEGSDTTLVTSMPNTSFYRSMRVVAAFLKDWDRLRVGPNNRVLADGTIIPFDFGGTLGARAQGLHKPGEVTLESIGSFPETSDLQDIYFSYNVSWLPADHPWRAITAADVREVREKFRTLDRRRIDEIMELASFSSRKATAQMRDALMARRDAIIDSLLQAVAPETPVSNASYWALQDPQTAPLTFEVGENRPARVSDDIRALVSRLSVPEGHIVLFRGQDTATDKVLSPGIQQRLWNNLPYDLVTQEQAYQDDLRRIETGSGYMNTLAYRRQEARKCLVMGYMLEPDRRYNSVTWWDRATPRDAMTYFHSTSNGEPYFISATRSLAIASRYIKYPRNDYKYRYVYVFVAPQDRVVSTWETMRHMQSYKDNQEEVEYSMLHDATPYIKAVYDTEIGQFLRDDTR